MTLAAQTDAILNRLDEKILQHGGDTDEALAFTVICNLRDERDGLLAALRGAESWLSGWASAAPYLATIRAAIAKAES